MTGQLPRNGPEENACSVLAVITARGGSKGLPGKNIRPLLDKPLLAWTVEAALQAVCVDRVVLSTDDPEIAEAGRAAGAEVPFLRPDALATDAAGSVEVVEHAVCACGPCETIVLLQPTSPLRHARHIDAAYQQMRRQSAPSCVSVTEVSKHPYLMYEFSGDQRLNPVLDPVKRPSRRQDYPAVYALNGALYFIDSSEFFATRSFVGPRTTGFIMDAADAIDIDGLADFEAAEMALTAQIQAGRRA